MRWPAAMALPIIAAAAAIVAPLGGVIVVDRARRRAAAASGAARIVRALVAGVATMTVAVVVIAAALLEPVGWAALLRFDATIGATTLALAAFGAWCAASLTDPLDAAALSTVAAALLAGGVFAAGPVLVDLPARANAILLLLNPVVGAAAAAGLDLFHTPAVYQLSPLAHTRVDYPAPFAAFTAYGVAAVAVLALMALQVVRRHRALSFERISA